MKDRTDKGRRPLTEEDMHIAHHLVEVNDGIWEFEMDLHKIIDKALETDVPAEFMAGIMDKVKHKLIDVAIEAQKGEEEKAPSGIG